MSIEGLLTALLLGAGFGAWVIWPFFGRRGLSEAAFLDRQRERALAYYERVLLNVRDLDEDHATGKIATDEYEAEREFWLDRGVRLLRLLDQLEHNETLMAERTTDDALIDAAIEDAIKSARVAQPQADSEDTHADHDADAPSADAAHVSASARAQEPQ